MLIAFSILGQYSVLKDASSITLSVKSQNHFGFIISRLQEKAEMLWHSFSDLAAQMKYSTIKTLCFLSIIFT